MSDFIFAQPSYLSGACELLDIFGTFEEYNQSRTIDQADAWALFNDFKAVGSDLSTAMERYATEREHHLEEQVPAQ